MIRNFFNRLAGAWADLHPAGRVLTVLILLGVVGFFGLKPAYSAIREWRVEQNLVDANEAIAESRMDDARDLSLNVLRSGDPRVDAYRILEKSTASLQDPRHGDIARALIFHPGSNTEDRLRGFQGIVDSTPLGLVGQAWGGMALETRNDPRFSNLFVSRLIEEKHFSEAASVLLGVPEENRNSRWRFLLGNVLIGTGSQEAYKEVQRLVADTTPKGELDDDLSLELVEGVPVLELDPEILLPLQEELQAGDRAKDPRASLVLARINTKENFSSRSKIFNEEYEKWKKSAPVLLASFLCDVGLHEFLLDAARTEAFAANEQTFPVLIEAVIKTGSWDQFADLAEKYGKGLGATEIKGYEAIAEAKTGQSGAGTKAWSEAIQSAKAERSDTALIDLSRIALKTGEIEFAHRAMIEAIRVGRGPLPLYSDISPLLVSLRKEDRENVLLEICARYLSFEPGNPILLTQYAYLAFFNGLADAPTVLSALEPMAKAFPNEIPLQRVLAAVYVCAGRLEDADVIFDRHKPDVESSPPEYLMAYYTKRILSEEMDKDAPAMERFPQLALLPSERKKFSELIRAKAPASSGE